jgi:hypothetical protein
MMPLNLGRCSNPQCGWWALEQVEDIYEINRADAEIIWRQVKIFDAASREVPIRLLIAEVKKNPRLVYSTHSDSFERLMTDCLTDKFPNSRVTHVGKSHDRGIDIFCIIDDEPCLVQVKRRKDGSIPEGPRAVRELNGVLFREGCYRGIFISTAERFTEAAFAELKIRMETAKPILVELIAFDGIVDLIAKSSAQYEPWKQHIREDRGPNYSTRGRLDREFLYEVK